MKRTLYNRYYEIRSRCYSKKDPAFPYYGAKGIEVLFHSVHDFIQWATENGWEMGLFLDRIDSKGPYSRENCRWVSASESGRNTADQKYYDGLTIPQWAAKLGLTRGAIYHRIKRGIPLPKALQRRKYERGD